MARRRLESTADGMTARKTASIKDDEMKRNIKNCLHAPKIRNTWVRHELTRVKGRKFRVLIYARYSTEEQNPRSIDDQVLYCKQFLASLGLQVGDYELTVLSDEGISGEKIRRPGIDLVWDGIEARRWSLIVSEDAGRIYRDANNCIDIVRTAVTQQIRTICINDEVDTADEENWEDRLYEAARHYQKDNKITSRRIKRAHEALWHMGAAIWLLKPGYLRKPTKPAANGEPAEGPFFDFVDPDQAPIIMQIYEFVAAKESPEAIANWLTLIGFRKTSNAQRDEWTARNVTDLIRRLDYRGVQLYRDTVSKKDYQSGSRRGRPNLEEEKLTRDMPHLRIVPDWLWYAANKVIDERCTVSDVPSGADHVLFGIRRDSRGPMSTIFGCGICEEKMHKEVRSEGGYRCKEAGHNCWNMATCLCKHTDRPIYDRVIEMLDGLDSELHELLVRTGALLAPSEDRDVQRQLLVQRKSELESMIKSLNDAIELGRGELASTVARLQQRQADLEDVCADLDALAQDDLESRLPTRKELNAQVEKIKTGLKPVDRHARDALKGLVGTIMAVPHLQFGTNKVVLRARFEIRLEALLPAQTRAALRGLYNNFDELGFPRVAMQVDLFKPSAGPEFGTRAFALRSAGVGPTDIGKKLGITKRNACIAVKYGKAMLAAGITDPYIELTAPPEKASRWGKRSSRRRDDLDAA